MPDTDWREFPFKEMFALHEPREQSITEESPQPRHIPTSVQFVGWMKTGLKQGAMGEWTMTIEVPADMREHLFGMIDMLGLPLHFDVQIWRPALEDGVGG